MEYVLSFVGWEGNGLERCCTMERENMFQKWLSINNWKCHNEIGIIRHWESEKENNIINDMSIYVENPTGVCDVRFEVNFPQPALFFEIFDCIVGYKDLIWLWKHFISKFKVFFQLHMKDGRKGGSYNICMFLNLTLIKTITTLESHATLRNVRSFSCLLKVWKQRKAVASFWI